jgi:hypothetical protein
MDPPTVDAGDAAGNKDNKVACGAAAECKSGFCSDGVCCETACTGSCESCKLPGSVGTCAPIPEGTDPDKECPVLVPPPLPNDGGSPSDDAATDGGTRFEADNALCGNTCNGKGKCGFVKKGAACGSTECNGAALKQAQCNGAGLCTPEAASCSGFVCNASGSACLTECAKSSDCAQGSYCDAQGKCKTKKEDKLLCGVSSECTSGFCVEGVCCNSACDAAVVPGGSCKVPGKEGQCTCSACTTGPCKVWYKDADNDGFGDAATTQLACANAQPAGFVASSDDCDDKNANAFPGQTAFFATPRTNGSFDYNCSGSNEKDTEETNSPCVFCATSACTAVNVCARANNFSGTRCAYGEVFGTNAKICLAFGSGSFRKVVGCGMSDTFYRCGKCVNAGEGAQETSGSRTQLCH